MLPRVVVVSPVLPHAAIEHAGGVYMQRLVEAVRDRVELTLICPNTPSNRSAATRPGAPAALLVGSRPGHSLGTRIAGRVETNLDAWLRRVDPGVSSLPFARGLVADPEAREVLERADVIDLQWAETIRLAPVIRRINRRARLVGTFHDVQSQLFSREPSRRRGDRLFWRAAAARSRVAEAAGVRRLDAVLAFSRKDLVLLGNPRSGLVIDPPLTPPVGHGNRPHHRAPRHPVVLFVAHFKRDENDRGAQWLLADIWPRVVDQVPEARLRLVGGGMPTHLSWQAEHSPAATAVGFVEDLVPEFAAASVVVVPLRQGAGVKFKTVEALIHGVPVVTTPIGAEGVEAKDGADLFEIVSSDPGELAAALVRVLRDPAAAQQRADRAQQWAFAHYGPEQFVASIMASYALVPVKE